MKPTIVILTGPTCAGKSTLERMLKDKGLSALKSVTTREPRAGEVDGETYDFVDVPTFDLLVKSDSLVEHVEFNGNLYGLSAASVKQAAALGRPAVVVVEPKGRDQIEDYARKHNWRTVTVFVDNPSNVIAERFLARLVNDCVATKFQIGTVKLGQYMSLIEQYSKRLASILSTEAGWRAEAHSGWFTYDILLDTFGPNNDTEAVERICRIVFEQVPTKVAA